jgi:hypothetical protein
VTATQFALAVRADSKWVQNAARILGARFRYTIAEVRWLGLVRILNREFSTPLVEAGRLATVALRLPPDTRELRLLESDDGSAAIVLDLARYHSSFAASLSAALTLGTPRRRGRRADSSDGNAIERARKFGVDLGLLRSSLALTPTERLARLDSNARFIASLREGGRRGQATGVRRVAERRAREEE